MDMIDIITLVVLGGLGVLVFLVWRRPAGGGAALEQVLRDELRTGREEASREARNLREEVARAQKESAETAVNALSKLGEQQSARLGELVGVTARLEESNRKELESMRNRLEAQLKELQQGNESKLEQMRQTVDEKLHSTLEKRLGESFKLVSERLEAVQRGLGEMKSLADGVGDLKRVLTNVKERGTWGEYQLGAILEQILTPEQYEARFHPKEGAEQVEYAVKLPGRGGPGDEAVWLPIDAKFPKEDYERLVESAAAGDAEGVKRATNALAGSIEKCAKDIRDKYINPPRTTDFAIMFLPTEGLYAEVLRHPGLADTLQQKYHVLPTGPTTLAAILNSLRVGFHTLAIEKRSSEVWEVLAAVKTEFGKFGEVLEKVQDHLNMAAKTLDKTAVRTRMMERKLRMVHEMPAGEAGRILEITAPDVADEDETR
jgi:DNA recombination protein RmuC